MNNKFSIKNTVGVVSSGSAMIDITKINSETGSKQIHRVFIVTSPFGNCQIFSIQNFESLYKFCDSLDELEYLLRWIKKNKASKPMLCIDIYEKVFNKIKDHFKIHQSMKYRNFTTSNMVVALIDLRG